MTWCYQKYWTAAVALLFLPEAQTGPHNMEVMCSRRLAVLKLASAQQAQVRGNAASMQHHFSGYMQHMGRIEAVHLLSYLSIHLACLLGSPPCWSPHYPPAEHTKTAAPVEHAIAAHQPINSGV